MMRLVAMVGALAACSGSRVGPVRFANAPPVWRVNDRHDVPTKPRMLPFMRYSYHFDSYYKRALRGMALERDRRALGVNSFDEVPDSTWFTNRIGVRSVTADEIRTGPGPDSPDLHLPWTIDSGKVGGTKPGFVMHDARGVKFVLKVDRAKIPELDSASDVIIARLLSAAGYNVPADHVVYFRREDLRIGPGAYVKHLDDKRPMDEKFVDLTLVGTAPEADGRYRGLASVFIPGVPLGGTPRIGVRSDDPNDRITHELRRDQRGQAPLHAWLSNTDIKEDNTFDSWQKAPNGQHHVMHYLLDFGNGLGADAANSDHLYRGYRYEIDPAATLSAIFSLGLRRESWENREPSTLRGIGLFSDQDYDPGKWKPNTPGQLPVVWADRFDQFWGAKILIRFTRVQLAAAVDAARFSDPRSSKYMVDTLVARQRRTAWHWFQRVNPIDDFKIENEKLCFTDLALYHRLETQPTRFALTVFDASGREVAASSVAPDAIGRTCAAVQLAPGVDRYTIVRIESSRGVPGTLVHIAVDGAARPRVIGIHRL